MKQITSYIKIEKTESGAKMMNTVRLWSYVPSSLSWIMKLPFPASADIVCGKTIIILTNLALLVEGFLTDIVTCHIEDTADIKMKGVLLKLNTGQLKWKNLITKYTEYFNKDLNNIPTFKSIEILFEFRNNIAHGKTYSEQSIRKNDGENNVTNYSVDKKYEKVRQYLIEKGVIRYEIVTVNKPQILDFNVPNFFYFEVKSFLFSVINEVEFDKKENIYSELTNAYIDCI